jgi:hypothetical protein
MQVSPPPPTDSLTVSPSGNATSPHRLKKSLVVLLWLYLVCQMMLLVAHYQQAQLIDRLVAGERVEDMEHELDASDRKVTVYSMVNMLVFIVTGIVFSVWVYRIHKNCQALGAQGMRSSPGLAVVWYYVPIACLFMPYLSMVEVWKVSKDPVHWKSQPRSSLLSAWWGCWLLSAAMSAVIAVFVNLSMANYQFVANCLIVLSAVGILLSVLAMSVVKAIHSQQDQWIRQQAA